MEILMAIWTFFAKNFLQQPAYFIGLIVAIGYILLGKKWYDVLAGFLKACIGYKILLVGSSGLTSAFRPILVGLQERFNISAMVIDPYFGQNAVSAGLEAAKGGEGAVSFLNGYSDSNFMILLLFALILNIVLVRFRKVTKLRALFTTGHVQVQQAATALWLILFCFPTLGNSPATMVIMTVLLGLYWAVGSNLCIGPTQELTDGASFTIAHQQMFGIYAGSKIAGWMNRHSKKESKNIDDIKLPGFLKIFNENLVATAILMTLFFGVILALIGKDWLVANNGQTFDGVTLTTLKAEDNFFFYIMDASFAFAVYLSILQLGVRTFVTELTNSFQGIANKLLPGSVPGVDCAVAFGFGAPNAVTLGFLAGAVGQFLAIGCLLLLKSPTLVVAGFVPLFFDNAVIGLYANDKGGLRACLLLPFISGLLQVFGSAFIASFVGMAAYGGYLGMWDWAVVWPVMTVFMKYLSYAGVAICAVALIAIPQLQYRIHPKTYFLEVEDYQKCKEMRENGEM